MYRLSRKEMRIIEETKREGAELQQQEEAAGTARKHAGVWSIVAFAVMFVLLVVIVRLVVVSCT